MNPSDDQRFKELTDRLVAMSPEPPPFPEETVVSTPGTSPRRSPLLVFAGAAAAVLLAVGIPLVLLNNQPPLGSPGTSTTTSTSTPATDPGDTTTTTVPSIPVAQFGSTVYLTQSPENSFLGNPALVAFYTMVDSPADSEDTEILKNTLNMLGDPDLVLPPGMTNSVPTGVEALNVRRADGADNALIIDMNEAFLDGAGGLLADTTMLNQLIYTATNWGEITEVQFIVNNQPVTQFGSEGIDLSSSVNRESFQEDIALIYLTSPILSNGDGNVVVEGTSNTFEASLSLRVLDAEGGVVHEEFGMATCGSGCWGDFLFVLDPALFESGTSIQLFEYSAEDGDPQNIITIPFNTGQPWELLP